MPFQSKAQRAYMFIHHPEIAKRWAGETPKGARLPQHKNPVKKAQSLESKIHKSMGMKAKRMV